MTQYEIYTFILCLIVFLLLTALLTTLLAYLVAAIIRLIRCGEEDEEILKEYQERSKKKVGFGEILNIVFSFVVCVALFIAFAFATYLNATKNDFVTDIPSFKIVKSASMSYINQKNTHLIENKVSNQLQTFDLVLTEKLPDEFELELYDIVVYKQRDDLIIHRIVGIEEPNEKHPDCRYFTLQGDAVQYKDSFPVLYSQMRGIYRDTRIPMIGSFFMFMQSPAGWLCILLIVFAIIATPLVEKKIEKEKLIRLQIMRYGAVLPPKARPLQIPSEPLLLSHTRLDLKAQKESPQIFLTLQQVKNAVPLHRQNKGDKKP